MSSTVETRGTGSPVDGLARLLTEARSALAVSLQEVADQAGCSAAYVHKLEQGRVRTPSPRVLAGLARALGLDYAHLMDAAGYGAPAPQPTGPPAPAPRFSNAHIVQLLEALAGEVAALRQDLERLAPRR